MRREEGNLVLLEVRFVCSEHAIKPREELLRTVIAVQNDGTAGRSVYSRGKRTPENLHAIFFGNSADMEGGGNSASDGSLLLIVRKTFPGKVSAAAFGNLNNDRRLHVSAAVNASVTRICPKDESWPGSFENGIRG